MRVEIGACARGSAQGDVGVAKSEADQSLVAQILGDPDSRGRVAGLIGRGEVDIFGADAERDFAAALSGCAFDR